MSPTGATPRVVYLTPAYQIDMQMLLNTRIFITFQVVVPWANICYGHITHVL